MATKLKDKIIQTPYSRRPSVVRETGVVHKTKPIIVELYESYMIVRLKGHQHGVRMEYDHYKEQL